MSTRNIIDTDVKSKMDMFEMFVVKADYTNPDNFGVVDVSSLERLSRFSLILENPYIMLDRWVNPIAMQNQCKLVIASNVLPTTGERSSVAKFCYQNRIPFVHCSLNKNVVNRYVNMYGCTFVNLAELNERPKLLLVHIPEERKVVDIPDVDEIIGLCTDTVSLRHVTEFRMPGKLYGQHKKEFASKCKLDTFITYPKQEHRKSLSKIISSWMNDEEDELRYEET